MRFSNYFFRYFYFHLFLSSFFIWSDCPRVGIALQLYLSSVVINVLWCCCLSRQPTHATYLKIPESQASFLIGFLSVGSFFGRLFFGRISDFRCLNRLYLYQTALVVMAVTTTLCPMATTYAGLIVYTLLFGIFDGAFVALIAVLTGDIVGSHKLPSALGFLYLVFSVPIMTGSLIAGNDYLDFFKGTLQLSVVWPTLRVLR